MAESNKRKIADPIDLKDEDPFAELTRIMGFDPRFTARAQPANEPGAAAAKPVGVEIAPAPAVQDVAHDDFGIDLEKELMGEFADHEPAPVSAPPLEQAAAIQPDDTVEMLLDDDFEDAFAASLESDAEPVAMAAEPVPIIAASQPADAVAEPYDDTAFDEAFVVEPQPDLAPERDLVPEFEFDDLDLSEPHHAPSVPEFELDDLDLLEPHHEASAPEFELDDLDLSEPHPDEALAEPELPVVPVVPARVEAAAVPVADALAEVDMDFSTAFDEALRADDHARDLGQTAATAELPHEEEHGAAGPVAPAADTLDLTLEQELSAMLDDAHADPAVHSPSVTIAPRPAPRPAPVPTNSRWSALETDREERAAEIVVPPAARASEYRRPFIDPALVGRLASFQAAPASAPRAEPAPQPLAPEPEPEEDLDDLLAAMAGEAHSHDHATPETRHDDVYTAAPGGAEDSETAYAYDDAPAAQGYVDYEEERAADHDPAPDVETIDVPEMAVAVADDLDIPEIAYEQDEPAASYDDLDADYHRAYAAPAEEPAPVKNAAEEPDFDADFESLYRSGTAFETTVDAAPSSNGYAPAQVASVDDGNAKASAFDEYDDAASASPAGRDRFVDLDFDNDIEEKIALHGNAAVVRDTRAAPQRRGLLIAAVAGGVALLGGVGALALSFGNGAGAGVPVVVKADNGPVKVKPENPGGTSVPNQDNKVYDVVKGSDGTDGAGAAPTQERLVTTSEEPVDMAAVDETANDLPGVTDEDMIVPKAEDRVDPAANTDDVTAESIAVAPRKVKTMVVRADGTLAPREDPAPGTATEAAAAETASAEVAAVAAEAHPLQPAVEPAANDDSGGDQTGAVTPDPAAGPTFQSPGEEPVAVPVKTVKTDTITAAEPTASVPATGPAVEGRPAEQPVDVVGKVKPEAAPEPVAPEQVASANVEPAAIAAGSWSVQIASQPSADSAKSTYQDLAHRYGGVIGGRGVNIVKADIAGKGTYWRVRVPAQSRDDAIKLCTDYKSAGGNCFVSK